MLSKKTKWLVGILLVITIALFVVSTISQFKSNKIAFEAGKKAGYEECLKKQQANAEPATKPLTLTKPMSPGRL